MATENASQILIVEDELKLVAVLSDYLSASGYGVHAISNGLEAIEAAKTLHPDLIVLDLTLPGCDGFQVCRDIRTFSEVPIIITTARIEEVDRLVGLEMGADDYICKPYSPRELVARVKAILRRTKRSATPLTASDMIIDEVRFIAVYKGQTLNLTPIEFRLLKTLAGSPGRVFSRQHLLNNLYLDHRVVTDRTVDSHVKNLRRKLQSISPGEEIVYSIYGIGYKIEF